MFISWGSHYFAQRNVSTEIRTCETCRRVTRQTFCDAFRVFHLYWVPLIPLGWKRVLNKCSACSSQRELSLKKWQAQKTVALEKVKGHFESDPTRLDFALEALEIFWFFGERTRASDAAKHLESFFSEDPSARAALTRWYSAIGDIGRAAELSASPPGPEEASPAESDATARTVGTAAMVARDFTLAKEQLLKLQAPAGRDLWTLLQLAAALAALKKPAEAYEVYAFVFRHFPDQKVKNVNAVKSVRKLEAALNIRPSIVPAGVSTNRDLLIGLGIVACGAVVAVIALFLLSQHQDLYLVNGTKSAAVLRLDRTELRLAPGARLVRDVAEGEHTLNVKLANGFTYERKLKVENTFTERLANENAFVFDVLGASVLSYDRIVYGHGQVDEGREEIYAGHDFYIFHKMDYPFEQAPRWITTEAVTETRFALNPTKVTPPQLLEFVIKGHQRLPHVDARAFAEGQLRGGNSDEELVSRYLLLCQESCDAEARPLVTELGIATGAGEL